jgi:hypothetical protein
MFSRLKGRPSPAMLVALVALFLALGGPGYAATGGNFVLGVVNTATSSTSLSASGTTPKALAVTNTSTASGSTALALTVPSGHQPLTVNRSTRVANLNADWLDGIDSTGFVRKGIPQSAAVGSAGVVDVTNTADGGYGVAGHVGGEGAAIYGEAPGKGYAGYFDGDVQVSGNLLCPSNCVNGSTVSGTVPDAAKVDGASIISNRVVSSTAFTHILDLPGLGYVYVGSCDGTNATYGWVSDFGPPASYMYHDLFRPSEPMYGNNNNFGTAPWPRFHSLIQLARNTGATSQIADITITVDAATCSFAGQAVVQPG